MLSKHILVILILSIICYLDNEPIQYTSLTSDQMLEDFDALVQHIEDFAVHKDINAVRLGIDYEARYAEIRSRMNHDTSPCEFKTLVKETTNLVQDLHCSFPSYDYLSKYGQYQDKINFADDDDYEQVKEFEEMCPGDEMELELPILYLDGEYIVHSDFQYGEDVIRYGTRIIAINGLPISKFIWKNLHTISPVKWDMQRNEPYHLKFYHAAIDSFGLTFESNDIRKKVEFSKDQQLIMLENPVRNIGYFSQKKPQVMNLASNLLYIGLPLMDESMADQIIQELDSLKKTNQAYDKVILDIRGNPGGSDMAWRNVISHLIVDSLPYDRKLMYKYNTPNLKLYSDDQDHVVPEVMELLGSSPYWTTTLDFTHLVSHENSLNHTGSIFVLQDEYIYSSASNLSDFCKKHDQLISIGTTNDYIGGAQTNPIFKKLPNSGLIVRVEPMLDYTDVEVFEDIYHNHVEQRIPKTLESQRMRLYSDIDVFDKDFLISKDPLINYVLLF